MDTNKTFTRMGRSSSENLVTERYFQGGWERLVLCASHTQVQNLNYGSPLLEELNKLKAEGWELTYSLKNPNGRTYYFKRARNSVPRRLKETAMW
jgi:hypothetical protein